MTKWTESEVSQLLTLKEQGLTDSQIAEKLGKSYRTVTYAVRRYGATKKDQEIDYRALSEFWKKKAGEAERALTELNHSKTAVDVLCEQAHALAPKSYQPPESSFRHESKGKSSPQSAVLLFSDTHIGAVVKPEQTLGLGAYNFEIFLRRLNRLRQSVFSILQDHTTTDIPEIVIPILGDMLDGALTHSAECGQANTMLEQFYAGGHAIAQFVRDLSAIAPIRIYGCVGNHTRWQHQKRMASKNRNSNFDMMLYLYVEALLRDIPTIKCHFDNQPFALFDVQGFPMYGLHGDNIRGGDKMLGIPNHAMGRMVSTTSQLFTRAGREMPAYYVMGHLHRNIELPHAKGSILVNGAFPGIDGFALGEYFNAAYPCQRFFLMHPKFGITAEYKLRLDLGDNTPHGFKLPESAFTCK